MEVLREGQGEKSKNRMPGIVEAGTLSIAMFMNRQPHPNRRVVDCNSVAFQNWERKRDEVESIRKLFDQWIQDLYFLEKDEGGSYLDLRSNFEKYMEKLIGTTYELLECYDRDPEGRQIAFDNTLDLIKVIVDALNQSRDAFEHHAQPNSDICGRLTEMTYKYAMLYPENDPNVTLTYKDLKSKYGNLAKSSKCADFIRKLRNKKTKKMNLLGHKGKNFGDFRERGDPSLVSNTVVLE